MQQKESDVSFIPVAWELAQKVKPRVHCMVIIHGTDRVTVLCHTKKSRETVSRVLGGKVSTDTLSQLCLTDANVGFDQTLYLSHERAISG
jgi:hypothetical protein